MNEYYVYIYLDPRKPGKYYYNSLVEIKFMIGRNINKKREDSPKQTSSLFRSLLVVTNRLLFCCQCLNKLRH